jgi:hypothetical protein
MPSPPGASPGAPTVFFSRVLDREQGGQEGELNPSFGGNPGHQGVDVVGEVQFPGPSSRLRGAVIPVSFSIARSAGALSRAARWRFNSGKDGGSDSAGVGLGEGVGRVQSLVLDPPRGVDEQARRPRRVLRPSGGFLRATRRRKRAVGRGRRCVQSGQKTPGPRRPSAPMSRSGFFFSRRSTPGGRCFF